MMWAGATRMTTWLTRVAWARGLRGGGGRGGGGWLARPRIAGGRQRGAGLLQAGVGPGWCRATGWPLLAPRRTGGEGAPQGGSAFLRGARLTARGARTGHAPVGRSPQRLARAGRHGWRHLSPSPCGGPGGKAGVRVPAGVRRGARDTLWESVLPGMRLLGAALGQAEPAGGGRQALPRRRMGSNELGRARLSRDFCG